MKWCLLLLLRGASGRTRHGFRNATRAVRLPVDGALQPIVALDVAPGAVGAALALGGGDGAALGGTQPPQSSLAPNWYDAVVEHQKAAPAPTSVQVWYSTPRYVKGNTHASGT